MELYRFDRDAGHAVSSYGSRCVLSPLTTPGGGHLKAACFHFGPGGNIGRHPATTKQLFCVVAGEGWAAGADGERVPIRAGQAAGWEQGEEHDQGTETGMTAIILEGDFEVFAKPLEPAG
jgi:hypothetical protein